MIDYVLNYRGEGEGGEGEGGEGEGGEGGGVTDEEKGRYTPT